MCLRDYDHNYKFIERDIVKHNFAHFFQMDRKNLRIVAGCRGTCFPLVYIFFST